MSNVLSFPKPAEEPQQEDGDGGDGDEIVVRVVIDWPEIPEEPETEPEPKRGRLGGFLWGCSSAGGSAGEPRLHISSIDPILRRILKIGGCCQHFGRQRQAPYR